MIFYLASTVAWPLVAVAQTAPPVIPGAPAPTPGATPAPPEVIAPPAGTRSNGSAGDQPGGIQKNTQGVIHPQPAIDPSIVKPTPPVTPQSMVVIPPPGTAGSNSNVEPK